MSLFNSSRDEEKLVKAIVDASRAFRIKSLSDALTTLAYGSPLHTQVYRELEALLNEKEPS